MALTGLSILNDLVIQKVKLFQHSQKYILADMEAHREIFDCLKKRDWKAAE